MSSVAAEGASPLDAEPLALTVVIPVYREVESLPVLCDRFDAAAPPGTSYEILFVDDGNYDNATFRTLTSLKSRPHVRVIHLSRNFGQHVAIAAGLKNARGEHILVMDADLQYEPADCLKLLDTAHREGKSLVLSTIARASRPPLKALGATCVYGLMGVLGTPLTRDDLGAVFLVNRHIAHGLARMFDRYRFTITMALWLTNDVAFCRVEHRRRAFGASGYTLRTLILHSITGLTSFSSRPLYIALFFALVFACGALAGIVYLLAEVLVYGKAYLPGWASTIVLILTCSAVILGCLGILGIYVGRIFDATQGRPLYYVRQDKTEPIRLFEDQ